jgi:hypothetical protein
VGPPPLGRSLLVALFVAITWGAATFAVAGLLAVLLDRDPIAVPSAPAVGVAGFALAGLVVWLATGLGMRARSPWPAALAASAGAYFVVIAAAFIGSFELFVEQAGSPFLIAGAVLGGVAVVATRAVVRRPPNAGLSGPSPYS